MMQEIVWKLILAVIIGGLIGAEREYRSKSAGFRALTLICLGGTLFTILSQLIIGREPGRIAPNVLGGLWFVGAGGVFKGGSRGKGRGITPPGGALGSGGRGWDVRG